MAMSLFGFRYPETNLWLVALVAATAATGGRVVLAHFAQRIARSRWVRPALRDSLHGMAALIQRRRRTSALVFLFFAFSPLPSNALFLAYGLTRAPLSLLAVPFFAGRVASYAVAFAGGSLVSRHFDAESLGRGSWLYFIATQLALLGLVYGFTRVDWPRSFETRRVRWLP
jgi:membrane protein YqaA with SNARE-associated domain